MSVKPPDPDHRAIPSDDREDDDIPAEIDFSRGQRGQFYRPGAALGRPVDFEDLDRELAIASLSCQPT